MPPLVSSFLAGALAGYGIAIPVGAIAVLIIEIALRRGLAAGLAAGAGAATADGLYALLAAAAGTVAARLIEPLAFEVRVVSALVLVAIAGHGLVLVGRTYRGQRSLRELPPSPRRTFLTILGLTIVNPMTVVYFSALILGLPAIGSGPAEKLAFVAGAFLASLSWQSLLALGGSLFHQRLPAGLQLGASLLGNLIILAFGLNIARGLLAG